jgi:hypothetical protein
MQKIICQKCLYYYVTWQPRQPHGCKAYEFKSKELPSKLVFNSSGEDCKVFTLKHK